MLPYDLILRDMKKSTTTKCASIIYQYLNLRYIKLKDIRKVDLCERIYEISISEKMCNEGSNKGSYISFIAAIDYYIQRFIKCEKESLAEKYQLYAQNMIGTINTHISSNQYSLKDVDSLFAVFLALIRAQYPYYNENKKISEVHLSVSINDIVLLRHFMDYEFWDKPFIEAKKNIRKWEKQKKIFYIHCIVYLFRLMQEQGDFEEV